MTYDEFQVYFHAFNNTYSALARTGQLNADGIKNESERIANFLTEKYKTVEKPVVPDLTSAVETAFKNFGKGTKK